MPSLESTLAPPKISRKSKTALAFMSVGVPASDVAFILAQMGMKVSANYLEQLARRRHARAFMEAVEPTIRAMVVGSVFRGMGPGVATSILTSAHLASVS